MDDIALRLPGFEDVRAAAARIRDKTLRTPLLRAPVLDALTGGTILLKAECLQRTGTFKFRGAYNKIVQIPADRRAGGVVAYSSGNHAQGVAAAAAILKIPAAIVMPSDAPAIKRERVAALGGKVVLYDRVKEDREALGRDLAAKRGATLVPPFDDFDVIAGQGTAGLELMRQARDFGLAPDAVIAPCSGGGLIAGIGLAVKALSAETHVHTAEPEGFDDMARSLASGRPERNEKLSGSVCDALLSPEPGRLTFAINRGRLSPGLVVSDTQALEAVAYAFRELKLVVEPGGAVALAAVLSRRLECRGRVIAVVLSGGNVDPELYARAIGAA